MKRRILAALFAGTLAVVGVGAAVPSHADSVAACGICWK